jgi:hypothetical protein
VLAATRLKTNLTTESWIDSCRSNGLMIIAEVVILASCMQVPDIWVANVALPHLADNL